MSNTQELNLDTSVLFNYLYSTILANHTSGRGQFEPDKGCRKYFESGNTYLVVGGKVTGEFSNKCNKRHSLYEDMADFLEDSGKNIVDYNPRLRDVSINQNDYPHVDNVKIELMDMDVPDQLSTMRRAHQQLGACRKHILNAELDDKFGRYSHSTLRNALEAELDVDHDCDVLVDAAHIARDHSIPTLAALDSDITYKEHQTKLNEIIHDKFDPDVTVRVVKPPQHQLN